MSLKWKKLGLTAASASALFLAACEEESVSSRSETLVEGEEIELASGPWDTEIASTNVIASVLEDVGYDVTITQLDAGVIWNAIANNEIDGQVGAWMPQTSAPLVEEFGDRVVDLGPNLEGAGIGLAVPTYMEDINSIADLTDEAEQVITGIEPGSSVVGATQEAIDMYDNLNGWTVDTSSTGAMTTVLGTAYENQEEIIITAWSPHWKFLQYDLKYLEDPEGAYGDDENIHSQVRVGFEDEHPIAYSILDNFQWETEDIESVMLDIQEGADAEQASEDFVENNPELVSEWTEEAEEIATSGSSSE